MASELSKFIDDELLREGNTGERSQLLNGGTFNVEKPRQRQSRFNIFSKRNIAFVVILTVVVGAMGIAISRIGKTASNIHGSKRNKNATGTKDSKAVPGGPISAGPDAAHSAASQSLGPGPAPAPAPALGLAPAPADSPIGAPSDGPYPAPSSDQSEIAPAPAPSANEPAPKLLMPRKLIGRKGLQYQGRI